MAEPCSSSSSDLIASDEGQLAQLLDQDQQHPAVEDTNDDTLLANMEACFKAFDKDRWVYLSCFYLDTFPCASSPFKYRPISTNNKPPKFCLNLKKEKNKIRLVNCLALVGPMKRALKVSTQTYTKCHSANICDDTFDKQSFIDVLLFLATW